MISPAWVGDHMPSEVWDEITFSFPTFNGGTESHFVKWYGGIFKSQLLSVRRMICPSHDMLLILENDVLKSQIASLSDEVINVVNSKKSPKPPTTDQSERSKSPTLLIGGSSVWTDSYGDVIIHVGTNDCATKCPTDKIFNNFRDISVHAKRVSCTGTVKFSSITPRVDNPVPCC